MRTVKPARVHPLIVTRAALLRIALALLLLGGVMAWLGGFLTRMPGKSHQGPLDPLTAEEVSLVAYLEEHVEVLAGRIGVRNRPRHAKLEEAAAYIESSLAALGFAIERQSFDVLGESCRNLAVEIRGATRPDEIVVVGAHYDTVPGSPGANDNATGVAATLALARSFAGKQNARTVRFLAFVNEEPPYFQTDLMGSRVYARRCRRREENVVAMLSLETMGRYSDEKGSQRYPFPLSLRYPSTGNFIAFVGNLRSAHLVQQVIGSFRRHARFPSQGGAIYGGIPGVGWSDHWAFWKEGYPALMVTDTAPFRDPEHYHMPTDTPDRVQYGRLARVVAGLTRVLEELLNP